jgi:hypothetical protein
VVVIAAGYDTRAYRLSRPGVKFYEIDLPHASKNKQELVRSLLPADKVRARALQLVMQLLQHTAVWMPRASNAWARNLLVSLCFLPLLHLPAV